MWYCTHTVPYDEVGIGFFHFTVSDLSTGPPVSVITSLHLPQQGDLSIHVENAL